MDTERSDRPQQGQSPEQKEWQGQRWEYLVMTVHPGTLIVKDVFGNVDCAPRYESSIKKTNKKFGSMLELLGGDGWELVGTYVAESGGVPEDLRLFFKRPEREE